MIFIFITKAFVSIYYHSQHIIRKRRKLQNIMDQKQGQNKFERMNGDGNKCCSSRAKKNWQKIRNIFKEFGKNGQAQNLFLKQTIENNQTQKTDEFTFLKKVQQKLPPQEMDYIGKNDVNERKNFINNREIIKTTNILDLDFSTNKQQNFSIKTQKEKQAISILKIITYRPIPNLNYLVNQELKKGNIDTTGTWVWQAEEILSYFLSKNYKRYYEKNSNMKILEIGAGCSGLAALALTTILSPQNKVGIKFSQSHLEQKYAIQTVITDGKQENIIFLQKNISENFKHPEQKKGIKIFACHYLWGEVIPGLKQSKQSSKFNLILGADILFFEQYHDDLILTLNQYLRQQIGVALFVNPKRGLSLENFISKLRHFSEKNSQNNYKLIHNFINFEDAKYYQFICTKKTNTNFNADTEQFIFMEIKKIKI